MFVFLVNNSLVINLFCYKKIIGQTKKFEELWTYNINSELFKTVAIFYSISTKGGNKHDAIS